MFHWNVVKNKLNKRFFLRNNYYFDNYLSQVTYLHVLIYVKNCFDTFSLGLAFVWYLFDCPNVLTLEQIC